MQAPSAERVWMNGRQVPWKDANLHIGSHVVHYASAVFEGIRCYASDGGTAIFRLDDHLARLERSAKVFRMPIPYSLEQLKAATLETIEANGFDACYIRPLVYRGAGPLAIDPRPCPVDVAIMVWEWGRYLGADALEQGVDVKVSSWTRLAPNTLPASAKSSANYMSSQLIKLDALEDGYAEGIALDVDGFVSEGSGENVFAVKEGKLVTPPLFSSVLPGITRDSVIRLARREGIEVIEERLPRELLYVTDELFFTGTAAEITPIRSVDRVKVGNGARGPVTEKLQSAFFELIEGRARDEWGWLTKVGAAEPAEPAHTRGG